MSQRFWTGCVAALFFGFLLKAWIEKPAYVAPVVEPESKNCPKEYEWDKVALQWRRIR